MSYNLAWLVAVVATGVLAWLVYLVLRKVKLLAYFMISVGSFWALWPWEFEDGFFAPLFVVFFYQTFLEVDQDPAGATAFGLLGTLCIGLVFLAILLLRKAASSKKKSV
ncbi:MAG: hypothetical protein F4077_10030 [Gammaproteobacteria bacterium]|nr:hypothetical protein [Gammaproteobacteria bacterium]MYI78068.1 hypothetical protein [Gammaproteobacteria bacterium]